MAESAGLRIGLGSVQWGLDYGIANSQGRPSATVVAAMLVRARAAGVALIDTAAAYGAAEEVIGGLGEAADFALVTKTLPWNPAAATVGRIEDVLTGFRESLARLCRERVHGLLVHHADELLAGHGTALWQSLAALRAAGRVGRLGVSVYDPVQLARLLDGYDIDLVQLPLNLYDQRFVRSGLLAVLKARGIEVHVRSALLQGALILDPAALPSHLSSVRELQARWHAAAAARGVSPLAAAIGFCLDQPEVDHVILGCEPSAQLEGLLAAGDSGRGIPELATCAVADEVVIDPRRWPPQAR